MNFNKVKYFNVCIHEYLYSLVTVKYARSMRKKGAWLIVNILLQYINILF